MDVLCRVVEGRLSRCTDADALLAIAFKGLGSLSGSSIDAIRARVIAAAQQHAAAGGAASRSRAQLLLPPSAPMFVLGGSSGGVLTRSSGSSDGIGGGSASNASSSSRASPWPSPKGHAVLSSASERGM